MQKLLGAEGTSLQWRLIASHLITRFLREEPLEEIKDTCAATQSSPTAVLILTELFTVLGYFAVNNTDNQVCRNVDLKKYSSLTIITNMFDNKTPRIFFSILSIKNNKIKLKTNIYRLSNSVTHGNYNLKATVYGDESRFQVVNFFF